MNWLNRLERKFGRYAIPNLPLYIALAYGIGAMLNIMSRGSLYYTLSFNPYLVLQGQVWRLVSFLIATTESNIIFLVFMLLFYYSIGQSLSHIWGAFRFNMYILVGILGTMLSGFIVYAITRQPGIFLDTYYLNLSIFLAYAAIFPDMQVYLYALIPIKVRWLAYLDVALLLYTFIIGDLGTRICIIVSLLNFLLFFFSSRNYKKISPGEIRRKQRFKKEREKAEKVSGAAGGSRHYCAVCGRTEKDDPDLEFRFCSKCNGNYEYCSDHLFSHEHIK